MASLRRSAKRARIIRAAKEYKRERREIRRKEAEEAKRKAEKHIPVKLPDGYALLNTARMKDV
jgi:hypothetical protein